MNMKQASSTVGTIKRLDESTRDSVALAIWLVVLAGAIFLNTHGESKLTMTGLMFFLTGAYSTFLLCGKLKYGPIVHAVPYGFALLGAALLALAPDFHEPVKAGLAFLALIAAMHASVIYDTRRDAQEMGPAVAANECA
jgi:hypothetical protein